MVGEIGGDEEEKAAEFIQAADVEAGVRLHRRLHGAARQDDGPRGRDHLRLVRDGAGEEGRARGCRDPGRDHADRGRRSSSPTRRSPTVAAVRRAVVAGVAALVLVGLAVAAVVLARGEGEEATPRLADCRSALSAAETRDCYSRTFAALVRRADDPRDAVERIGDAAWAEGGFLLANCHGLMHTVGRAYARAHDVTLATLMDYLRVRTTPAARPGSRTGSSPASRRRSTYAGPRARRRVRRAETRYQRYSCVHGFGHAFMRVYDERLAPALALCRALGRGSAGLRAGRVPRLLVRGQRRRRRARSGRRRSATRASPLRRTGGRVRGAVLVPRVRRQPPARGRRHAAGGRRAPLRRALGRPPRGLHHRRVGDRPAGSRRAADRLRGLPRTRRRQRASTGRRCRTCSARRRRRTSS